MSTPDQVNMLEEVDAAMEAIAQKHHVPIGCVAADAYHWVELMYDSPEAHEELAQAAKRIAAYEEYKTWVKAGELDPENTKRLTLTFEEFLSMQKTEEDLKKGGN